MCELKENSIVLCKTMKGLIDPQKGLDFATYNNFETGKQTRQVIIAKTGDHRKKGMAFNFCPITGKPVDKFTADLLKKEGE